jgi:hypothetical protein
VAPDSPSLVVRRAALGDFVLTLPVMEALATLGPVHVVTHARYAPLLPPGARIVDDAWLWAGAPAPVAYERGFAFGSIAAEALRNAGIREVHAVPPRPPAGVHAADHYAGVLPPGLRAGPPRVTVVSDASVADGVVIAPGSGGREKRWPLARWLAVAQRLSLPVVWVRGPDEQEEAGWPPDAISPDLRALCALAACCRAWLGPDSGPSHLAAAVRRGAWGGEPVLRGSGGAAAGGVAGGGEPPAPRGPASVGVVFGPTDPANWAPPGARVFGWDTPPEALAAWVQGLPPGL